MNSNSVVQYKNIYDDFDAIPQQIQVANDTSTNIEVSFRKINDYIGENFKKDILTLLW